MKPIARETIVECPECGSGMSHYSRNGNPEKYACRACYITLPANDMSLAIGGLLRVSLLAIPLIVFIWVLGLTPNTAQARQSTSDSASNLSFYSSDDSRQLLTGIKSCNWTPSC